MWLKLFHTRKMWQEEYEIEIGTIVDSVLL